MFFTENILISPANFRSLMLDVMSFVEKFGYTETSEINIPRNMNEINWWGVNERFS